ncbi:MAG: hypothetical protein R3B47_05640 [Bacteroidia bacterium]
MGQKGIECRCRFLHPFQRDRGKRRARQADFKENAQTLGFDVFYDTPLGHHHAAFTLYGVIYYHDWGLNTYGGVAGVGSGTIFYAREAFCSPLRIGNASHTALCEFRHEKS